MPIVAVVLTLNEEQYLADCLLSLRQLTIDIIVLDSGSCDRTPQIACQLGARVVTRQFHGYANQRNAALDLCSEQSWLLFLDADERLTTAGAAEMQQAVAEAEPSVNVWRFPRSNVFWGRVLRGGGWWPDYQPRLVRPARVRYDEDVQVHEVLRVDGETRDLREPVVHLNYASPAEFIARQRDYTRLRASAAGAVRPRRRAYVSMPTRELVRRFVALGGYRDGPTGLFLATVMAREELRACRMLRS